MPSSAVVGCQIDRYAPRSVAWQARRSDVLGSPRAPGGPAARSAHGAPSGGWREGSRSPAAAAPAPRAAAPAAAAAPLALGATHTGAAGDETAAPDDAGPPALDPECG